MVQRISSARYFLFATFLCWGFFVFFHAVYAEISPQNAVIVRPAKAEVAMSPGEERSIMFTVSNDTGETLHVSVSFEDIAANEQASAVDDPVRLLGETRSANSLKDVLSVSAASFDVPGGGKVNVPVFVRMQKDAEPGGRYGSAIFRFSKLLEDGSPATSVALEGRIATLLYVRILGDVLEEGRLVAFGLFNNAKTSKSPTVSAPLRMQVAYQNTGTVHLNPYGRITIRSIFGGTHVLPIDPSAVLPGATRMREVDQTDPLLPGYYTAHLELNRGYQDIVDEQKVSFVVLPSPSGWLIFFAVLVSSIWLLRRSLQLSRHSV